VETLDASPLVLDILEALAEADSLATGPGVWSPWKASLIHDLAVRCRSMLAGDPHVSAPPRSGLGVELAAAVTAGSGPQLRFGGDTPPVGVVAAVPPSAGALAAVAGVLALHSLEVHAAALGTNGRRPGEHSQGDVAVFELTVSPRFGGLPDPALLRAELVRALDGTLPLAEALARKERDYAPMMPSGESPSPPRVLWFDDEATGAVIMELRGTDRIGLLHRIAAALSECAVNVRWARVSTLGSSVVDSFCLAWSGGQGALPAAERARIEKAVTIAAS
jgi:[protein-PII] uridylyltransferase